MSGSQRFRITALAMAIPLLLTYATASDPCPSGCRFRLCFRSRRSGNTLLPENVPLLLRTANRPQGPFPCEVLSNRRVRAFQGVIGGQARVAPANRSATFVPISRFKSRQLIPIFSARHFRWTEFAETGFSTFTRRISRGSQERALDNLCVQMPIRSRLIPRPGSGGRPVRITFRRRESSCVGFRSRVAHLDIEFQWNSSSNYELRVMEPGGFEISRFGDNSVSPNGGTLMQDRSESVCDLVFGRERVTYSLTDTIESGTYNITVDNSRSCASETSYTLRVHFMGFPILTESGTLRDTRRIAVLERNFVIF